MARISEAAIEFGISIQPAQAAPGQAVYRVKDIFTTRDGSWEPSNKLGSVPQWARDTYLKPYGSPNYNDDGGASTHLFGAVWEGDWLRSYGTIHFFTYTDNQNHAHMPVKRHGWANIPLFGASAVPGPWAWFPVSETPTDVVMGGGLPGGWHVSTFAVWERVVEPGLPPIEPPTEPLTLESLAQRIASLEAWRKSLGG